ncbi:hypothetical protein [Marinobacterium sp. BA1]|uniref:hypothetical protein n=1 Tax=Marinobacterium sp. BA1 TaxID=3138931 RepID=UPI0032E770C9
MNYDSLSLEAVQWITWISLGAGGLAALSTLAFGLVAFSGLSAASDKTPVERFALTFVSHKRYMVPVAFTLMASACGAVTSMDYRSTISDTIATGAQVLSIPPKALVTANGEPLRVMENEAMFKHVFSIDVKPIVSVLGSRGYIREPSQAKTDDLIKALKHLAHDA